jgi:hypothetical protein
LRCEIEEGFGKAQHHPAHRRALIKCGPARSGIHAQRGYGTLRDELALRCLAAENNSHPDHPSVPIMPTSIVEPLDMFFRIDASPCSIKINVVERRPYVIEQMPQGQGKGMEIRKNVAHSSPTCPRLVWVICE